MDKPNEINILTKECILTALLRLMDEKDYNDITITDITNLAGVSRMAYYRNYKSKEDILITHLEDAEKTIINKAGSQSASSIKDIIYYVSYFIQENAKFINAIYTAGLIHRLTDMLNDRIYNYFPISHQSAEGEFAVRFYVGAILSVYRYWIDTGMKEPVENVTELLCRLIDQDNAIEYLVFPQ